MSYKLSYGPKMGGLRASVGDTGSSTPLVFTRVYNGLQGVINQWDRL